MDQLPSGGDWVWECEVHGLGRLSAPSIVVLSLPTPWNWKVNIGVWRSQEGTLHMDTKFKSPIYRDGSMFLNTNGLPREAKRAIRKAFPLAVLML